MADTAAHLVDNVIPLVPVRQWVLTLPIALRYRLAYDADLTSAVIREFLRAVFASLRRRARRFQRIHHPHCGAVTVVQRFGDALNLNVHFHSLMLDGVYDLDDRRGGRFISLPPPGIDEVRRILVRFIRRLELVLERKGLGPDADPAQADCFHDEQPLLAGLAGASVHGRIATGSRAGQRVRRLGDRVDAEDLEGAVMPCSATVEGFSLHAAVCVPARDRKRLERLCRYAARPPVATERLSRREDGKLVYQLRHRWRDGTTHVLFDGVELVEKLAALVPRPRFHMVRYHGILAPAASRRDEVVPRVPVEAQVPPQGQCAIASDTCPSNTLDREEGQGSPRRGRLSWAQLMRRVFQVDVMVCPRCAGALRIMAEIRSPTAIRAILDCLKLPSRPPPIAPVSQAS
jgi:hypothetical protein